MKPLAAVILAVLAGVSALEAQDNVSCGSTIVSATVVSTYCGHQVGADEVLELLVLWRGAPGWFQGAGGFGSGSSAHFTAGAATGRVTGTQSHSAWYGDIAIGIEISHDVHAVKIGEEVVPLNGVNVVLVDGVDEKGNRRIAGTRWIEPKLPTTGDLNLLIAQRSPEVLEYLRCDIPMPPRDPPLPPALEARVCKLDTVCQRLSAR